MTSRRQKRGQPKRRALTHEDILSAAVRVDPALRRRSELLWEDRAAPTRGPKPAVTTAAIVGAAMELADAQGLRAVTMQAVAGRLGLTTMALYRYFPSKEALCDAIVDAGMGLPPPRAEPRPPWRIEVAEWARARRAMLCARPWLAELPFVAAPHGPHWLLWLESLLDSLARTGLRAKELAEMLSVVDGFTRGASDTAVSLARAQARGVSTEEWAASVGADLGRAIGDPRFPNWNALLTAPPDDSPRTMEQSFDFCLDRVLDGIELYVRSAKRL